MQGLRIAIDADMADAGRGHEIEHAFEKTLAGAQDRDDDQLLALEDRRLHLGERCLDRLGGHRQVAGDLIGEKEADLAQQLAEYGGRRVLVAH